MQNLAAMLALRGKIAEAENLNAYVMQHAGAAPSAEATTRAISTELEIGATRKEATAILPNFTPGRLPQACQRLYMLLFQFGLGATIWAWSLVAWGRLGFGWAIMASVLLLGIVPSTIARLYLRPYRAGMFLVLVTATASCVFGSWWLYRAVTGELGAVSDWTFGTWIRTACALMLATAGIGALRLLNHPEIRAFRDQRRKTIAEIASPGG
jgi:hypothetical protein